MEENGPKMKHLFADILSENENCFTWNLEELALKRNSN